MKMYVSICGSSMRKTSHQIKIHQGIWSCYRCSVSCYKELLLQLLKKFRRHLKLIVILMEMLYMRELKSIIF